MAAANREEKRRIWGINLRYGGLMFGSAVLLGSTCLILALLATTKQALVMFVIIAVCSLHYFGGVNKLRKMTISKIEPEPGAMLLLIAVNGLLVFGSLVGGVIFGYPWQSVWIVFGEMPFILKLFIGLPFFLFVWMGWYVTLRSTKTLLFPYSKTPYTVEKEARVDEDINREHSQYRAWLVIVSALWAVIAGSGFASAVWGWTNLFYPA